MKYFSKQIDANTALLAILLIVLLSRLFTMWQFPLIESTEPRYAEIARKMLESNDWITLQQDYGVAFWAKPPLTTWLSAASQAAFGINHFAARLPSLILAIIILLSLRPIFIRYNHNFMLPAIMLASMGMFYLASGSVMTDMGLLLAHTLIMVGFFQRVSLSGSQVQHLSTHQAERETSSLPPLSRYARHLPHEWGGIICKYFLFIGMGIGLLAKGPVSIVLAAMPIFAFLAWTRSWHQLKLFPWFSGIILTIAISLPWYLLAELKTPGFLNYFIYGEHIARFISPGWSGDMYGNAHNQPLGTIWIFLLADASPWLPMAIVASIITCWRKKIIATQIKLSVEDKFLICWLIVPNLFFTFAHNIIETYPLVSLPAAAALSAKVLCKSYYDNKLRKIIYPALLLPIIALILNVSQDIPTLTKPSAYKIAKKYQAIDHKQHILNYVGVREFSMDYYNLGKVKNFSNLKDAIRYANNSAHPYIAVSKDFDKNINTTNDLQFILQTPRYNLYKVDLSIGY